MSFTAFDFFTCERGVDAVASAKALRLGENFVPHQAKSLICLSHVQVRDGGQRFFRFLPSSSIRRPAFACLVSANPVCSPAAHSVAHRALSNGPDSVGAVLFKRSAIRRISLAGRSPVPISYDVPKALQMTNSAFTISQTNSHSIIPT